MAAEVQTVGLVLAKEWRGEGTLRLEMITPEGWWQVLKRVAKKAASGSPDLFDTAEVRRGNGSLFLQNYRPEVRRISISQRYEVFRRACQWGAFWVRNVPALDFDAALYTHATRAADAFAIGHRPATVVMKSLYWLARREGYAVNQGWLASLEPALASAAGHCLRQPLEVLPAGEVEADALLSSLAQWLARHTDFSLPAAFQFAP